MEGYLLSFGLGYLVGLAILGYAILLKAIKIVGSKIRLPKLAIQLIVLLHYAVGMLGLVYVPAFFYRNYLRDGSIAEGVIFSMTGIVTISIIFWILLKWDNLEIRFHRKEMKEIKSSE